MIFAIGIKSKNVQHFDKRNLKKFSDGRDRSIQNGDIKMAKEMQCGVMSPIIFEEKERMARERTAMVGNNSVLGSQTLQWDAPMSPEDFVRCAVAVDQYVALNDPEEAKKRIAHNRILERDMRKSQLRMQEATYKANLRNKRVEMFEKNQEIWFREINLNRQIIRECPAFHCRLKEVKYYLRETGEEMFQLIISTESTTCVFSPLYEIAFLKSMTKLRQTILCEYDCTQGQPIKNIVWEWIWKDAIELYKRSKIIRIPALPGWYDMEGRYSFWAQNRRNKMLQNKEIKSFELRYIEERRVGDARIQKIVDCKNAGEVGALLLMRLIALLGRLCAEEPIASGLILYGDTALETAKRLLSVSMAKNNIFNLDADRTNVIRSKVRRLRDDVAIFVLTDQESRSTQNRTREVMSWFNSGYIEGDRVTVPFVGCVKRLSQSTPSENCILVNTEMIDADGWEYLFDVIQSCWVDAIEQSGSFIVEQLKKTLKQQETKETGELVSLSRCIASVTDSYICSEELKVLQPVLDAGVRMIEAQSRNKENYIVDIFCDTIDDMVKKGMLKFCHYTKDAVYEPKVIYYDDNYYYFTGVVMTFLCDDLHESNKFLLLLKQQLARLGYLKLYGLPGKNRELQVDITLKTINDIRKHVSVVAVENRLWDDIGGISLWERGETVNA